MKIIVDHRRTKVIFDQEKNQYIKVFNPKLENKIKFFFGLRKYPGKNFEYISKKLNEIGIETPRVLSASKYKVVTENIGGILLSEYLKKNPSNERIVKEFLDIIVKVLKNDIYFGDFNTGNFIVKDEKIYALDLEDYRKVKFLKRDNKEAIRRLRKTLRNEKWIDYIIENIK